MNVLLVYPNIHGMNMLPPAIGLFSAVLKKEGHNVDLFDTTHWIIEGEEFDSDKEKERSLNVRPFDDSKLRENIKSTSVYQDFNAKISNFQPHLIAVSVTEDLYPVATRLLDSLEHQFHDIPVIIGGVFATFAPNKCLAHPHIDIVCIGEGETPLVELCRKIEKGDDYSNIKSLWIKMHNGTIVRNELGMPENVDENPLLDMSIYDESSFYRPMQGRVWRMFPVETHRGCPYQCTYCNSPVQVKLYKDECNARFFRKKSFERIYDELKFFKDDMKAEAFYLWADTFMSYSEREFDQFKEIYSNINLPF